MFEKPSRVLTRKPVVDRINNKKSCKSNIGIDASELRPNSVCQAKPTELFPR